MAIFMCPSWAGPSRVGPVFGLTIGEMCLSFFLLWDGTCSLRMPAMRSASQAGPMRNPRKKASVVLRDTIRLT